MNLQEAAAQARKYPHGSRLQQDAMSVLFNHFRAAHPGHHSFISLDILWSWVNKTCPKEAGT